MMSGSKGLLICTAVWLIVSCSIGVTAHSSGTIVVNNADTVRQDSITVSQGLLGQTVDVQPRIVLQYANLVRHPALAEAPAALQMALGEVSERIILQHANDNRATALVYPVEVIADHDPPQGSYIETSPTGETSATISWSTDEYADSTVRCGTRSGVYPMVFSDPLYVRQHAVTVTGLTVGTTYHCRVSSTDLSGNTYQSHEFTFSQAQGSFIYLPLVLRN